MRSRLTRTSDGRAASRCCSLVHERCTFTDVTDIAATLVNRTTPDPRAPGLDRRIDCVVGEQTGAEGDLARAYDPLRDDFPIITRALSRDSQPRELGFRTRALAALNAIGGGLILLTVNHPAFSGDLAS